MMKAKWLENEPFKFQKKIIIPHKHIDQKNFSKQGDKTSINSNGAVIVGRRVHNLLGDNNCIPKLKNT